MKPVIIGDCTLFEGDCLDILPGLAPAHLLVTDAPYKLTTGGLALSQKTMSGKFAAHNYDNQGALIIADVKWADWLPVAFAALTENADAYVMANDKHVSAAQIAAEAAGFRFHNLLVVDKASCTTNRWYMKNCEFTLYLWKGRARTINFAESQQLIKCPFPRGVAHPTQKPVDLMQHYIENSSAPGDLVLDPFMGSGTTAIAALRSGRRFVGMELDPQWFPVALDRIGQEVKSLADRPALFAGVS